MTTYYFAKSKSNHMTLQVQRVHKDRPTEPLFDVIHTRNGYSLQHHETLTYVGQLEPGAVYFSVPVTSGITTAVSTAKNHIQPIGFTTTPDGSGFRVEDAESGRTIGRWTKTPAREAFDDAQINDFLFSNDTWSLVSKGEVLATLRGTLLEIHPETRRSMSMYLDEVALKIKRAAAATFPPSADGHQRAPYNTKLSSKVLKQLVSGNSTPPSQYRARFIDGLLFSALSLALLCGAGSGSPKCSETPGIERSSSGTNLQRRRSTLASIFRRRSLSPALSPSTSHSSFGSSGGGGRGTMIKN